MARWHATVDRTGVGRAAIGGLLVAVALSISGCGSASSNAPSPPEPKAVRQNLGGLPLFHQADYDIEIYRGWTREKNDEKAGPYLESAWNDPASDEIILFVDSRAGVEDGSSRREAERAREKASRSPDYHERSFDSVGLGGHRAIRWVFREGHTRWLEFFFDQCGIGIVTRGTAIPTSFGTLGESFQEMSSSIGVHCQE